MRDSDDETLLELGRFKEMTSGIVVQTKVNPLVVEVSFDIAPKIGSTLTPISLVLIPEEVTTQRVFDAINTLESDPWSVPLL